MHPFNAILECLCMGRSSEEQPALGFPHEKEQTTQSLAHSEQTLSTQSLAEDILSTLYTADTNDEHLAQRIQEVVHETEWYEDLAITLLNGLENALKAAAPMGQAMKEAHDKAAQVVADIWGFAKEHPVFCAVVALGVLVILLPWAIEVLGFGELGPTEGTFAAWWQSTYGGPVPAGSLFSFFQRLGMVWRWDPKYHGPIVR